MTEIDSPQPPAPRAPPRPWGYFSTFGWVVLAHVIGTVAGFGAVLAINPASLSTMADFNASLKDGWLFSLSTVVSAPVMVLVLVWAVRLRHLPVSDYLAFVWPDRSKTIAALAVLAIGLPALDAAAWLSGQPVVSPFQIDIYVDAQKSGALPLLWLALVVAAPVWEEIAFRGFLYRGWVRSAGAAIPGILIISAFFAILHVQYNWFGILQVFALGLMFGWARWHTGSTLITIVMHAITNFYSTLQTVVVLKWMS